MTSLRTLLAFNMKENRRTLGLSQEKLAEKVQTSTQYIGMIETEKKFPSPEMLTRIAVALKVDTPQLFSMTNFPEEAMRQFQAAVLTDIEKAFAERVQEFANR